MLYFFLFNRILIIFILLINHINLELIKGYKKILKKNKNDYYSILISNIVINCAANCPNCMISEIIYPHF
jgi:hypothetical protein